MGVVLLVERGAVDRKGDGDACQLTRDDDERHQERSALARATLSVDEWRTV
jgi:hypothetical protein